MFIKQDPLYLSPWAGFARFCAYAGVALGLGAWRLWSRDA
jgi:hypothetical protein